MTGNQEKWGEAELLRALQGLPRRLDPARDLWPRIQRRLDGAQDGPSRAVRWRLPALAAALVLAFIAGAIFEQRQEQRNAFPGVVDASSLYPPLRVALEASEREYQAVFQALTPVGLEPALLDAQALEKIEGSWRQLQEAEAALLGALEENPGNPFLAERLLGLRAQQLEFVRQLYMLDQNSRRNT